MQAVKPLKSVSSLSGLVLCVVFGPNLFFLSSVSVLSLHRAHGLQKAEPNGSSAAEVPFVNHFDLDTLLVCNYSRLSPKICDYFQKNAGFP